MYRKMIVVVLYCLPDNTMYRKMIVVVLYCLPEYTMYRKMIVVDGFCSRVLHRLTKQDKNYFK